MVKTAEKYGFIDKTGEMRTPMFDALLRIDPKRRYIIAKKEEKEYIVFRYQNDEGEGVLSL